MNQGLESHSLSRPKALSQDVSIIKGLGEPEGRAQDKGILTLRKGSGLCLGAQPPETVT